MIETVLIEKTTRSVKQYLYQGSASNLVRGPVFFLVTRWRARVWVTAYLDAAIGALAIRALATTRPTWRMGRYTTNN